MVLLLNPIGFTAVSPGSLRSSAPGVKVNWNVSTPEGSQQLTRRRCCDPSGVGDKIDIETPGAPLRGDPGLMASIPSGSESKLHMTDKEPPDNYEVDEELERWADLWGMSERDDKTAGRWLLAGLGIVVLIVIAVGLVYLCAVNGNG